MAKDFGMLSSRLFKQQVWIYFHLYLFNLQLHVFIKPLHQKVRFLYALFSIVY